MCVPHMGEVEDLQGSAPSRYHQLLVELYINYLHHNNGMHLDGGVSNNSILQHRWCQLVAQSSIWYSKPLWGIVQWFATILAAGWQEVLNQK